jgi:NAD(P)-dependent dehydrogenase (short-subunit alcohol dehydrogenase family)
LIALWASIFTPIGPAKAALPLRQFTINKKTERAISVDFSVKDKVIVITGATGVICSTIAKELAGLGAKLVWINRHAESGQVLETEIRNQGGEAIAIPADVLDKASLLAAREETLRRYGKVDVLINGAGGNKSEATTSKTQSFFDLDLEAFTSVLDRNLTGAFLATQVFGEVLVKQGAGVVLNIASMPSFQQLTNVVAYGAAKASSFVNGAVTPIDGGFSASSSV